MVMGFAEVVTDREKGGGEGEIQKSSEEWHFDAALRESGSE